MSENIHGRYCKSCGRINDASAKNCHACYAPLADTDISSIDGAKSGGLSDLYQAIRKPPTFSAITALISLFLIIFAFCPFISVKTSFSEKSYYKTSFSPVEIIQYSGKVFGSYSTEEELMESKEFKNFQKASKKVKNISVTKKLSRSDKERLENFTKAAIKLDLVSPNADVKANLIFASLMSICYIAFAVSAFISSATAISRSYTGNPGYDENAEKAARKLGAIALAMPIYLLTLSQAAKFSNGSYLHGFGNDGTGISWGLAFTLVLVALIAFYAAFKCFLKLRSLTGSPEGHNAKIRIITMLLLIAAVFSIFLPSISVTCAAPRGRKAVKNTLHISPTELCEISELDSKYYSQTGISSNEGLIFIAQSIAKKKETTISGSTMLNAVVHDVGGISVLNVFITVFASIFMILAVVLLKKYLSSFFYGSNIKKPGRHLVFTIIAASLYLILSTVLVIIANSTVSQNVSFYVLFNLGISPIFALIFSVAAYVFLRLRPLNKEASDKYDNPDVTSAPYVIN